MHQSTCFQEWCRCLGGQQAAPTTALTAPATIPALPQKTGSRPRLKDYLQPDSLPCHALRAFQDGREAAAAAAIVAHRGARCGTLLKFHPLPATAFCALVLHAQVQLPDGAGVHDQAPDCYQFPCMHRQYDAMIFKACATAHSQETMTLPVISAGSCTWHTCTQRSI